MQVKTVGDLLFPTAKVVGRSPNVLSLQLTPLFKGDSEGSSDDETEPLPEELTLEEDVWARSCLALAYDLTNTGVNEISK